MLEVTTEMKAIADGLLGWHGVEMIGAKDVLIWWRGPRNIGIAFQGEALKMQLRATQQSLPNRHHYLDLSLQKALGFDVDVNARGYPERQTMSDDDSFISEVLDAVGQLSMEVLQKQGLPDDVMIEPTLMPLEGVPWSPQNLKNEYYSAKKKKVFSSKQPPWIIEVKRRMDGEESKALGADFCTIAGRMSDCRGDAVCAIVGSVPFLVTHCLSLEKSAENAKNIAACGGLLFPSFAVGAVPATNFGHIVLVADPSIVLPGMKPYKKGRGNWPIVIYGTDAWTATTSSFMGDGAAELFDELTGNMDATNWMYRRHFWVLGPPYEEDKASRIDSTSKLRTRIVNRQKKYKREFSAAELEKQRFEHGDPYPYLEAKANMIVAPSCFSIALFEHSVAKQAQKFLRDAGFEIETHLVSDEPEVPGRNVDWDYAWRIRDLILETAATDPSRAPIHVVE